MTSGVMVYRLDYTSIEDDDTVTSLTTGNIFAPNNSFDGLAGGDFQVGNINVKKDSEVSNSRAVITIKNPPVKFLSAYSTPLGRHVSDANIIRFKEGDTFKIYAAHLDEDFREIDTSSGSADLLMSCEVSEVKVKLDDKSCKIMLTCVDKTYAMLNRLHTAAYINSQGFGADDIVKRVVRDATDTVEADELSYDSSGNLVSNGIYGIDARLVSEGGFIEDTRVDSSSFPTTTMAKIAKPAYDWLKDLSSIDATNDFTGSDDPNAPTQNRQMFFYVDELNRLHWFYPQDGYTTTLNGAITDSATTITLTDASSFPSSGAVFIGSERIEYTGKSSNDLTGCTRGANNTEASAHSDGDSVSTMMSITEGDTSTGHMVLDADLTKKTFDIVNLVLFKAGTDLFGSGISSYFYDRTTKTKQFKETEKAWTDIARELILQEIQAGRLTQDNSTPGPFSFSGNRYDEATGDYNGGSGVTTAWGTVVTSDSAYNNAVRDEAIKRGKQRSQALTAKRGSPRWKGNIKLRFKRYTAGELILFTSTRAGINQQPLRILSAQYNLPDSGFVTLNVEEDEDKVGAA